MIIYAAAGATGLAIGHVAFPRFLRAFIKHQYMRILREDEQERRRGLLAERAYLRGFEVKDDPVEPLENRPPPPPQKPAVGTHARRMHDFGPQRGAYEEVTKWQQSARHKREWEMLKKEIEFHKQTLANANEIIESLRAPGPVIIPEPEVEAIYEFGSKEPVAYVRVADGAQVEQMVCPECYMGYDYKVEARYHSPGSVPYPDIPPDAPKCKHCNGRGKFNVTRF